MHKKTSPSWLTTPRFRPFVSIMLKVYKGIYPCTGSFSCHVVCRFYSWYHIPLALNEDRLLHTTKATSWKGCSVIVKVKHSGAAIEAVLEVGKDGWDWDDRKYGHVLRELRCGGIQGQPRGADIFGQSCNIYVLGLGPKILWTSL